MKCPKCHYISFGSIDRCRNCGYEFLLAVEAPPVDLPIQSGDQTVGPLADFVLTERGLVPPTSSSPDSRATGPAGVRRAAVGERCRPASTCRSLFGRSRRMERGG